MPHRLSFVSGAAIILMLWACDESPSPPPAASVRQAPPRFPIGTNLNGLSYWSTELPFVDAFKSSGPWVSCTPETWNDGRALDLDERDWVRALQPGQIAACVLFGDIEKFHGTLPARYGVTYEGTGTIEYGEAARLISRGDHRDVIDIGPGPGNATLSITATDPRDHVRNIRAIQEGADSRQLFNPLFLESLKGYRALRMMIWMLGETDEEIAARTWADRPTMEDARWTLKGAPVEVMVALANQAHADPWFTIPHGADEEYVLKFAELVLKSLAPDRKVLLEYSNEVWNEVYPQTSYAREHGLRLGLSQDPGEATLRFYARRATEIFKTWSRVLADDRLVCVLAFQSDGDPAWSDEVALSTDDARAHVDAIAIGPYFGTDLGADAEGVSRIRAMSLDQFMEELKHALVKAGQQMRAHAAVARKYGVPLIAYEGGQHLWNRSGAEDAAVEALFNNANRDPRMGALYTAYLNDWADAGGGLFVHLLDCGNFRNAGNWGAREYQTQPRQEAPKYDALMRWMEESRPNN